MERRIRVIVIAGAALVLGALPTASTHAATEASMFVCISPEEDRWVCHAAPGAQPVSGTFDDATTGN